MKIKFLFGLVFVLAAFAINAQTYVSAVDAVQILETQATALENGTANINNLTSVNNATVTGANSNVGSMPIQSITEFVYPQIMKKAAKDIEAAGNTVQGIDDAKGFFDGMTNDPERNQLIDDVFVYITDLLTI